MQFRLLISSAASSFENRLESYCAESGSKPLGVYVDDANDEGCIETWYGIGEKRVVKKLHSKGLHVIGSLYECLPQNYGKLEKMPSNTLLANDFYRLLQLQGEEEVLVWVGSIIYTGRTEWSNLLINL